jgi:hypothetical protein
MRKTQPKQPTKLLRRTPTLHQTPLEHNHDQEKEQVYVELKHIPYELFQNLYDEFRQLHLKNDVYVKDFNILNEHRQLLLMEAFLGECPYIRGRKPEVKERIK